MCVYVGMMYVCMCVCLHACVCGYATIHVCLVDECVYVFVFLFVCVLVLLCVYGCVCVCCVYALGCLY